jgi:hypothetical protein
MKFHKPAGVLIWVGVCAYLNCVGWALSALHELNVEGYSVALTIGFVALLIWRRKTAGTFFTQIHWQKFRRRFRRPLPAIFLLVAAMTFLGGILYAPTNYDALTYRLPRILNWLAAGHWTWIPTSNARMNFSGTGWEWIATPFLTLLRSDRGLFLINAIGFLLMPGLLFSVFRQLGIARRVAWTWMWILPLAYGYATQAGSIGNDYTGTVFGLISVYYGLRARRSKDVKDIWLAAMAGALMTGTKISNLPLLLPCLIAVWPALPQMRKGWVTSVAPMLVAVLISIAPTIILNQLHTGSWTGDPKNLTLVQVKKPGVAFLGNSLLLLQQSFMPPVLPSAHRISDSLNNKLLAPLRQTLMRDFPRYYSGGLNELPQEETSGLGLGITFLLLTALGTAACGCGWKNSKGKAFPKGTLVGFAAWVALLFYMFKTGSEATGRLLLSYYPLAIVPILLLPSQKHILRFRIWKIFTVLAALSVLPAIILSPSRPMWPALSVSKWLMRRYPDKPAATRLTAVYLAYAHRNDVLSPLRAGLPDGFLKIGFLAGGNDTDYSLWRPFGLRQVEYVQTGNQPIHVPDDIEWIVVKRDAWPEGTGSLETWATQHYAKITLSVSILTLVSWGEQTWCLVHIERPRSAPAGPEAGLSLSIGQSRSGYQD